MRHILRGGVSPSLNGRGVATVPFDKQSTETSYPFFEEHIIKLGEPELVFQSVHMCKIARKLAMTCIYLCHNEGREGAGTVC
jgi:hypothetical protein